MQTDQGKTDRPDNTAVVRLLNGILKGCEYPLSARKTLFIAADCDTLESEGASSSFPEDCVLVPTEGGGVNFEIIRPAAPDQGILLRRLDDSGADDILLASNQPVTVGALALAVRAAGETWSDGVLNYQRGAMAGASAAMAAKGPGRGRWRLAVLVATAVAVLALVFFLKTPDAQQREIVALTQQLGDEPGKYRIFPGRDGVLYVQADNERAAAWGRQSLVRLKSPQSIKINSHEEEKRRIERWLGQNFPALNLHQLQFDQPAEPVLMVSRQRGRLDETQRGDISRGLMKQLPYAEHIHFAEVDDDIVSRQAEEGIKKLAISYTRINNQDSVTFVIDGAINDGERQRIRFFVEEYDRQWSGNYVQFAIELKDNWLKDKSFKYGHLGFVKMTPGHWYFPNIN
ncbi:PrgH/EprH family type III secretion apparatus protein [Acerihabitans arboris]|uniref:PrgH/EprH family type III secretion apparatus protein n=1 Tax=Acerihabitans arboris TaxID=2691583 RepID=A0A845SC76_9GAMM|nr:PrgH/EprH family type III secretion apparatus protein [Acerihabitans arboris]NDL61509.1 PrgH/EprH family type III secretion apparatus protein [Acerihabitans arboris]